MINFFSERFCLDFLVKTLNVLFDKDSSHWKPHLINFQLKKKCNKIIILNYTEKVCIKKSKVEFDIKSYFLYTHTCTICFSPHQSDETDLKPTARYCLSLSIKSASLFNSLPRSEPSIRRHGDPRRKASLAAATARSTSACRNTNIH